MIVYQVSLERNLLIGAYTSRNILSSFCVTSFVNLFGKIDGFFWPVFVVATLAAMIASQAMISATFSCIKQSMALGCFPRMKIVHTSKMQMGQIYMPVINWFLMTMCVGVVSTFRTTTNIANAYGKQSFLMFAACVLFFSTKHCKYVCSVIFSVPCGDPAKLTWTMLFDLHGSKQE